MLIRIHHIPALTGLVPITAVAIWLAAWPTGGKDIVVALFRHGEPDQTGVPDTLLLRQADELLLPQNTPWGWP